MQNPSFVLAKWPEPDRSERDATEPRFSAICEFVKRIRTDRAAQKPLCYRGFMPLRAIVSLHLHQPDTCTCTTPLAHDR